MVLLKNLKFQLDKQKSNFVKLKIIMLKPARISKFFAAVLIIKIPTKLFWWPNEIIFWSVSSKILNPLAK